MYQKVRSARQLQRIDVVLRGLILASSAMLILISVLKLNTVLAQVPKLIAV
jgi:hypothetical protein